MGYVGCDIDHCDNLNFKVDQTGHYTFKTTSNQTDITSCSLSSSLIEPIYINGEKVGLSYTDVFEIEDREGILDFTAGPFSLEKGVQYTVQLYSWGN